MVTTVQRTCTYAAYNYIIGAHRHLYMHNIMRVGGACVLRFAAVGERGGGGGREGGGGECVLVDVCMANPPFGAGVGRD